MRQAARAAQHPSAGWTSGRGMRSKPGMRPTVNMDPREIGRVSQSIRQAKQNVTTEPKAELQALG
jgi:hypothetical protein